MPSEQELIELRREKREALLARGDAYPATIRRTHEIAQARALFDRAERDGLEETRRAITIAGRVTGMRDMGRAAFVDVRDGSGALQLHLRRNVLEGEFELLPLVDLGDFVEARGRVFRTRQGEVTVAVRSWARDRKGLAPAAREVARPERRGDALPPARARPDRQRALARDRAHPRRGGGGGATVLPPPRLHGGRDARAAGSCGRGGGAPVCHAPQRARSRPGAADRPRAAPQAAADRRLRQGLRDRPGVPQRGHLAPPQPRVHAARVVRGVRRLRGRRAHGRGADPNGGTRGHPGGSRWRRASRSSTSRRRGGARPTARRCSSTRASTTPSIPRSSSCASSRATAASRSTSMPRGGRRSTR